LSNVAAACSLQDNGNRVVVRIACSAFHTVNVICTAAQGSLYRAEFAKPSICKKNRFETDPGFQVKATSDRNAVMCRDAAILWLLGLCIETLQPWG
jgi:hypothetical protein